MRGLFPGAVRLELGQCFARVEGQDGAPTVDGDQPAERVHGKHDLLARHGAHQLAEKLLVDARRRKCRAPHDDSMRADAEGFDCALDASDAAAHAARLAGTKLAHDVRLSWAAERGVQVNHLKLRIIRKLFKDGERVGKLERLLVFAPLNELHDFPAHQVYARDNHCRRRSKDKG